MGQAARPREPKLTRGGLRGGAVNDKDGQRTYMALNKP